jgi:hypothetical protein
MEKAARGPSHPQTQGHHTITSSALSFDFFALRSARVVVVDFRLRAVGVITQCAAAKFFVCVFVRTTTSKRQLYEGKVDFRRRFEF